MSDQRLTYTVKINLDPETAAKNIDSVRASLESLGVKVEKISSGGKGAHDPLTSSATQARMAVVGVSQALSDSGQFVYGFRSGMISVGNNLDMVVRSLITLKAESAAAGVSMKTQLLSVLTGPSGILLGVSALITVLTVLPSLLRESGEAAKEAAEGGLKEFADILQLLSPESRVTVAERIASAVKGTKDQIDKLTARRQVIGGGTGESIGEETAPLPGQEARVKELRARLAILEEFAEKTKEITDASAAMLAYEKEAKPLIEDQPTQAQRLMLEIAKLEEEKKKGLLVTEEGLKIADLLEKKQAELKRLQESTTDVKKREVDEEKKKLQLLEEQDQEIIKVAKIIEKHAPGMIYVSDEQQKRMERIFELTERIRVFMEQSADQRRWLVSENQRAWIESQLRGVKGSKEVGPMVRGLPPETDQELTALSSRFTMMGGLLQSAISGGLERGFSEGEDFLGSFVDAILAAALNIAAQQLAIAGVAGAFSLFSGVEFGAISGLLGGLFQFAEGGVIREPVIGMGMRSGHRYMIGERGEELVIPASRLIGVSVGSGADLSSVVSEIRQMRSDLKHLKQSVYVGNVVGEAEIVRRQLSQAERYHARKRKW